MDNSEIFKWKIHLKENSILTYRMRYVIPFTYETNYQQIENSLNNNLEWKPEDTETFKKGEVYESMKALYKTGDNVSGENEIGSCWTYCSNSEKILKLYAFFSGKKPIHINFFVKKAGLHVLKGKLGLFWYEIEFEDEKMQAEALLRFQNRFSEVSYDREGSYSLYQIIDENQKIRERIVFGTWIQSVLEKIVQGIKYFPSKEISVEETDKKVTIPNKALNFNYFFFDEKDFEMKDMKKFTYHMNNGYNTSYYMPSNFDEQIEMPFENVVWYTSKGGCSYSALANSYNKSIFLNVIPERVMSDYFFLYMNSLQQSYIIMNASMELSQRLSSDVNVYIKAKGRTREELEVTKAKINLFLMKNVYSSISNIGHHDQFYDYVRNRLRIMEDVDAIRAGLENLEELLIRKENDSLTLGLSCLSFLCVFSAFSDGSAFLNQFTPLKFVGKYSNLWEYICYNFIYVIYFLVIAALSIVSAKVIISYLIKTIFIKKRR